MRDRYPRHGKRWTWRHPFRWVCRCGLDAWPCPVKRMLDRTFADALRNPGQLYADRLAYAKDLPTPAGRWWARGAR